jgi:hypothetical protein
MNCHQQDEQLPFDSSNSKAAETNRDIQHEEIQQEDRLPLPPPSKFCRTQTGTKTAELVSAGQKRFERLAAYKAAISRMISNDEPAQWTSDSEISVAWMWEQQLMPLLTTEL